MSNPNIVPRIDPGTSDSDVKLNRKNLAGTRIGMLVVLGPTGEGKRGQEQWRCQCDCGGTVTASFDSLRHRRPHHCGCQPRWNFKDLTGMRFGWLTVIEQAGQDKHGQLGWTCRCDCGNELFVVSGRLQKKQTQHCGCKTKENVLARNRELFGTHLMSRTRIYQAWRSMKHRCSNPRAASYYLYGGLGVRVCDEWNNNFESFCTWAFANGYQDDLTLDRFPDPFGDYCPENCRWATHKQQSRNLRSTTHIEWRGQRRPLMDWVDITGLSRDTISSRLERGWSVEDALTMPVDQHRIHKKRRTGQ